MTLEAPVLSAGEILKATGGAPIKGGAQWSCRGLSTDTRTLREGNLFIALRGDHFDGHDCLAAATAKGASGLVIRTDRLEILDVVSKDLPVIGVPDTLRALGDIASLWRRRFSLPLVAKIGRAHV